MIKSAVITILLTLAFPLTSYAYTPAVNNTNGEWVQGQNQDQWLYKVKVKSGNSSELVDSFMVGCTIIDGVVCEFDSNGILLNDGQFYYHDLYKELENSVRSIQDTDTSMPSIVSTLSSDFWDYYINRLNGANYNLVYTGIQPNYISCDVQTLKDDVQSNSEFKQAAKNMLVRAYENVYTTKNGDKVKVEPKNEPVYRVVERLHDLTSWTCVITGVGQSALNAATGGYQLSDRDVHVAVATCLTENRIPTTVSIDLSTGKYYVCVYDIDNKCWTYYDFANTTATFRLSGKPSDKMKHYY